MAELIFKLLLIGSLIGMLIMILRKMPALNLLPQVSDKKLDLVFWERAKEGSRKFFLGRVSREKILQKFFSKIRVLALRLENISEKYLQNLREKSSKVQKKNWSDTYWEELKATKQSFAKYFKKKRN